MKRHCRSCLHYYAKDATIYTYIEFHSLEIGPLGETAKKVERYMGAYTRVQTLFGTTSTAVAAAGARSHTSSLVCRGSLMPDLIVRNHPDTLSSKTGSRLTCVLHVLR